MVNFNFTWSSNIESHNHSNFDGKIQSHNHSLFGSYITECITIKYHANEWVYLLKFYTMGTHTLPNICTFPRACPGYNYYIYACNQRESVYTGLAEAVQFVRTNFC